MYKRQIEDEVMEEAAADDNSGPGGGDSEPDSDDLVEMDGPEKPDHSGPAG